MSTQQELLVLIRERARQRTLFLPHAIRQMGRPDRLISTGDVEAVIASGQIIEDYPDDARGHSALLLGQGAGGRFLHLVCSPKDEYLAIITAYAPAPDEWSDDLRTRAKP
jgi:hypothetical protein